MSAQQRAQTELVASSWLLWDGGKLNGLCSLASSLSRVATRRKGRSRLARAGIMDVGTGTWPVTRYVMGGYGSTGGSTRRLSVHKLAQLSHRPLLYCPLPPTRQPETRKPPDYNYKLAR